MCFPASASGGRFSWEGCGCGCGGVGGGVSICTMLHCHTVTMLQHSSSLRHFVLVFSEVLQIFLSPLKTVAFANKTY